MCLWFIKAVSLFLHVSFQIDYDNAVRELHAELARGISLDELQANSTVPVEKEVTSEPHHTMIQSYRRKHDVQKWLQKYTEPINRSGSVQSSALAELSKRSVGQENLVSQKSFHVRNYEITVRFIIFFVQQDFVNIVTLQQDFIIQLLRTVIFIIGSFLTTSR